MNASDTGCGTKPGRAALWTGWILTVPIFLLFAGSAVMKFLGGPEVAEGMSTLGLDESMLVPLATLELICALIYLFPATAVLGAVLLSGYLGGAICTHWRVGDPFLLHIVIGVVLWLAVYFREPRLRSLLPFRRCPD